MARYEKRAQLYLPKDQFQKVAKLAREKHTTFAQLIREAIGEFLSKNRQRWEKDPITRHIGQFKSHDKDLSVHHDRYIYGE